MTRVTKNWENGNPTSMDKHAYWLPNQYIENNIFHKFRNRINAVVKGLSFTNERIPESIEQASSFDRLQTDSNYMILNQSSTDLPLPEKSIDTIITDPPYGSNVQYGELSSFWNVWLKAFKESNKVISFDQEAVMNRKKNIDGYKDVNHYENVLLEIFKECNRVLKDDGYLVFTFNNKNIKVWIALLKAIAEAGFYLPKNGVVFQDFVKSYKNTSHLRYSGNVHGDFIYSFKKGEPEKRFERLADDYESYIKASIKETITRLFTEKEKYTTAYLYQEIFMELINVILALIASDIESDENRLTEFEKQSNDYIDNFLQKHLVFDDDFWYWKG